MPRPLTGHGVPAAGERDDTALEAKDIVAQAARLLPPALPDLIARLALPPLVPRPMLLSPTAREHHREEKVDRLLAVPALHQPKVYLMGPDDTRDDEGDIILRTYPFPIQLQERIGADVVAVVRLEDPAWANFFGDEARAGAREVRLPIDGCNFKLEQWRRPTLEQQSAWNGLIQFFEGVNQRTRGAQRCCLIA